MIDNNQKIKNKKKETPSIHVLVQYIKDFSLENPNAPLSLSKDINQNIPINIGINVHAKSLNSTDYEIVLQISASAKDKKLIFFNAELYYGGVFKIIGINSNNIKPILMIECPNILFPFARRIISDSIRDSGFPPLMIDPINFMDLYQKNLLKK